MVSKPTNVSYRIVSLIKMSQLTSMLGAGWCRIPSERCCNLLGIRLVHCSFIRINSEWVQGIVDRCVHMPSST